MKPETEVIICDICDEYYSILDNPDYEFTYLGKKLDVCHNCYNRITKLIHDIKATNHITTVKELKE